MTIKNVQMVVFDYVNDPEGPPTVVAYLADEISKEQIIDLFKSGYKPAYKMREGEELAIQWQEDGKTAPCYVTLANWTSDVAEEWFTLPVDSPVVIYSIRKSHNYSFDYNDERLNHDISQTKYLATLRGNSESEETSYLQELFDQLKIKDRFDKAVLAAIVVGTILDNNLAPDVSLDRLATSVIGNDVTKYEFDVIYLASGWSNDLTEMLCSKIGYTNVRTFYPDVVWPYLRRKSPMTGVKLMS